MKVLNSKNIKKIDFDALIIGGGGSGLRASLELAKQGEINLKQEKEFGEILLKKRK